MYKSLGGYTWNAILTGTVPDECPITDQSSYPPPDQSDTEKTVTQTVEELHLALSSLRKIFTTEVFRGVLGLATWWSCFTIFATNAMGMFYQSYFANT